MTLDHKNETIQTIAVHLIEFAESLGMVLTIDLVNGQPLVSVNYKMVANVWPARINGKYEGEES